MSIGYLIGLGSFCLVVATCAIAPTAEKPVVNVDSLHFLIDSLRDENKVLRSAAGRCISSLESLTERKNGCGEVWRQRRRPPWSGEV